MSWCHCDNSGDDVLDSNFLDFDSKLKCRWCGKQIVQEDVFILLLKNVIRLNKIIQELESEKEEREQIKIEQEIKTIKEEMIFKDNENKQIEQFNIMDL